MDQQFAQHFAADWIAAWNAHDLNKILAHYADDFVMSSPMIAQLGLNASGTLRGKAAVRAYWAQGLKRLPDLHFELVDTLLGIDSVTLYYCGARGRNVAEVFRFNAQQLVVAASAHYAC